MKHKLLFTALSLVFILAVNQVQSQIPQTISYQGVLTDASGTIVPDAPYTLTFKLYDVPTGSTPLWTEVQSATVTKGIFNVVLGSVNLLNLFFDKPYWLGVTIGAGTEMIPRVQLTSAAYSLNARTVQDASITKEKISNGQVVKSLNTLTDNVTLQAGTNVSITPSGNTLTISSSGGSAGVSSINSATGAVTLTTTGGATVSTAGNTITINAGSGGGGTGIQGVQNTDNTLDIANPGGPTATINMKNLGVTTPKLADGSVTQVKIASGVTLPPSGGAGGDLTGSYPNPNIASNAVTTTKLADASVTQVKIAPGVTLPPSGAAGGDLSGTYPNPNIATSAVTTTKLADNSVTSAKIVDLSITGADIANATIDASKLSFSPVARPLTPGVATAEIADNAVTGAKINLPLTLTGNTTGANAIVTVNNTANGICIKGSNPTGNGLWGESNDAGRAGVIGVNLGGGTGVWGESNSYRGVFGRSNTGTGIYGESTGESGVRGVSSTFVGVIGTGSIGVQGTGSSDDGVRGYSTSATSNGVYGNNPGGNGVHGWSNTGRGVFGQSTSETGVRGESSTYVGVIGTSTNDDGVRGLTTNAGSDGVYGNNPNGKGVHGYSNTGYGVHGESTSGAGVNGVSSSYVGVIGTSTTNDGIRGIASSATFDGVFGSNPNGKGVHGYSNTNSGVYGESVTGNGVYGKSGGAGSTGGVVGVGTTGTSTAIVGYATSFGATQAGWFEGAVHVTGNLTGPAKLFQIDHPLDPANKYLYHIAIESPDMKNVYDGVVTLDINGEAVVQLPAYFETLNSDYRYQLTCIGGYASVYIADEVKNNEFKIAGGKAGLKVSWQVTGIRQDAYAKEHRIIPEVEKTGTERGKYLYPIEHGVSETLGINYEQIQKIKNDLNTMSAMEKVQHMNTAAPEKTGMQSTAVGAHTK